MNRSIGDVFEDYIDDLVNLPSEVHDKMKELRFMDEEFQRHRYAFGKQKRAHLILLQNDKKLALSSTLTGSPTTPSPTTEPHSLSTVASLELVEKEYKAAIDIQDQKIDTARQMYDRVSLHIEQLDFEMVQNNISIIPAGHYKQQTNHHQSFPMDHHDISSSSPSSSIYHRQRSSNASSATHTIEHSSSPRPRYSSGGLPQKHYLDVDGSRKRFGSTGSRKRAHYLPRSDPPFGVQVLAEQEINPNEPRYCHCNQVSYGDMVACDGDNCEKEWFHYSCVGLVEPPVGKWFCSECMTN